MTNIRDVARLAGVSISTASVVLSGKEKFVSEMIRAKVLEAANQLDYKSPQRKYQKVNTIAVILPTITSSFFSSLLSGISAPLSPQHNLLFYSTNYDYAKEKECVDAIRRQKPFGVILDTVCPKGRENDYIAYLKDQLTDRGIPVIVLERNWSRHGIHSIYIDNVQAAFRATEHLIKGGHKSIAHIAGNKKVQNAAERKKGYRLALEKYSLPYDENIIMQGDYTPYSGYLAMKKIMDANRKVTALFAANDQMAIGAIQAVKSAGYRVPRDMAVIGFDNLSAGTLTEPSLSTINVPTYKMGNTASGILLGIEDIDNIDYKLKTDLIIRRSSDVAAVTDWKLFGW